MSDSTGRKPAVTFGLLLYLCGTLLTLLASRFEILLVGRFLQGAGAAGPRIVSLAIIRDRYGGRDMARVFSLVMAVFIMAPVLAPALGQLILQVCLLARHFRGALHSRIPGARLVPVAPTGDPAA